MAIVDWGTTDCFETSIPEAGDVATIRCLEPLFRNAVTALVSLAGVALFVMLIIGGFNYMFAGGDMKKLEKAKGTISGALKGLAVVVVAYLVIMLIAEFTGLDTLITTFKIFIQ